MAPGTTIPRRSCADAGGVGILGAGPVDGRVWRARAARMAGPVKDREAFQRLNFLYQAAHCVLAQDPENQALARFYCHTERTIAKRLVLRRDPSVKRTLCRGCSSLLIPGLTCTQRQRRCKGQRWTVQTCLTCQRSQRFLNDPRHVLWGDRPEAQLGNQADPKPPQPLPNTAHPIPAQLSKEKVQPQSSSHP
ncbi:ribonuclease P protein subunit p21 isoform X1 [Bos indicus x Bos taurus]|uniref:ribonuclease P protein subunit p21 isoform X1 n=1 Tax=Bos indicus x Bos taurus TaxID=30522 RepID=UPI000F7D0BDB|nr:ribonuclease P protein subunit p21 isoform X1 [Bos indicus x Bos taurus]